MSDIVDDNSGNMEICGANWIIAAVPYSYSAKYRMLC